MGIDAGTPGQMETKWMVEMAETGEGTNMFQAETGAHEQPEPKTDESRFLS